MSDAKAVVTGRALDPQAFADNVLVMLSRDHFEPVPILYHVAALAAFRAAQRMWVVPPKIPEHVAADIAAAFRNIAYASQIPEVRAGASFLSTGPGAAALREAASAVWAEFFATEVS
jgi:hypothetical protein